MIFKLLFRLMWLYLDINKTELNKQKTNKNKQKTNNLSLQREILNDCFEEKQLNISI